ncbi:MAG: hypothetical protein O2819_03175 [Planctomycetota bacterium]|nr:hypothetical protein [Planctomycetota bacterium]MDA1105740.1 hypothetical protein [Planctomycetota bacterium]
MAQFDARSCSLVVAPLAVLAIAGNALAQSSADLSIPLGQTCSVTTVITIVHGTFGSGSDSKTGTHSLSGGALLSMPNSAPPFTSVTAAPMAYYIGANTYTFEFFCFPFIGCQNLGVNLSSITLTLPSGSSAVSGSGAFNFAGATWDIVANYTTSGLDNGTYELIDTTNAVYAGRLTATTSTAKIDQMSIGVVHFDVPPESLPSGVNAISIDITANISSNFMTGNWGPACASADLNCDGSIDGIDLGQLLAGWGGPTGDTNGDGVTDGIDLGAMLAAWGT